MDPLIELCSHIVTADSVINLPYYSVMGVELVVGQLDLSGYKVELEVDDQVEELNDNYTTSLIRDIVDDINLPKVYNRAENKLLNMITICKWLVESPSERVLNGYTVGDLLLSSDNSRPLRVYDCAAGPGGWSAWMLSHYPNSTVVGFTLKGDDSNFYWYSRLMSHSRFYGYYGDLFTEWESHTTMAKEVHFNGQGADLFTSDGGLWYEDLVTDNKAYDRSVEQRRIVIAGRLQLIVAEILAALNVTRPGGSIIIKLFNIDNPVLHQLLTVVGSCCQYSTVVKLITSRSQNREMFYLGLYRKVDVSREIELLKGVLNNWSELYPMSLVANIPVDVQQFFDMVVKSEFDSHLRTVDLSNRLLEMLRDRGMIKIGKPINRRAVIELGKDYHSNHKMNRYILYSILGLINGRS